MPTVNAASLTLNGAGSSITLDGTKNYDSVTLTNGATIYVTPYDGTGTTGTLILNVAGDVNVDSTSSIDGSIRGYRGGDGGGHGNNHNLGGSAGEGTGAGNAGSMGGWATGGGGGGGGASSYGSAGGYGGDGAYKQPGSGGSGGNSYGTTTGTDIDMGSGGGGGGANNGANGISGSAGGAKLIINANNINLFGTLDFKGGAGGAGGGTNNGGGGGGGGGGSGGGIKLVAFNININGARITTAGGAGGAGGNGYGANDGTAGASGGGGRIKIFYKGTLSNTGTVVQTGSIYYEQISCGPEISGDWTIPAATECICSSVWDVPANVYVYGTLKMQNNCNIRFTSSGQNIYVYPGANIYMYSGAGFDK